MTNDGPTTRISFFFWRRTDTSFNGGLKQSSFTSRGAKIFSEQCKIRQSFWVNAVKFKAITLRNSRRTNLCRKQMKSNRQMIYGNKTTRIYLLIYLLMFTHFGEFFGNDSLFLVVNQRLTRTPITRPIKHTLRTILQSNQDRVPESRWVGELLNLHISLAKGCRTIPSFHHMNCFGRYWTTFLVVWDLLDDCLKYWSQPERWVTLSLLEYPPRTRCLKGPGIQHVSGFLKLKGATREFVFR